MADRHEIQPFPGASGEATYDPDRPGAILLQATVGRSPLYALLIYGETDTSLIAFIREHEAWLDGLGGSDCRICTPQDPDDWGNRWNDVWRTKTTPRAGELGVPVGGGPPATLSRSHAVAKNMGIARNLLPCLVFVESSDMRKFLCIPIAADESSYRTFFRDLFSAVHLAAGAPDGQRIRTLQSAWKPYRVFYTGAEEKTPVANSIREWGSISGTIPTALFGAMLPFRPLRTARLEAALVH
jgi:hypothetical protein